MFTLSHLAQGLAVSRHFHPIHGHAHFCLSVLFFLVPFYFLLHFTFLLFLLLTMTDSDSMNYPLCHSAIGSTVSLDNCTPDTGYEPNVMEFTGTTELNNAASGDIYFQGSPRLHSPFIRPPTSTTTSSVSCSPVVVDRTGEPVERSDSDHFPCSVRNVKSAQNQFSCNHSSLKTGRSNLETCGREDC